MNSHISLQTGPQISTETLKGEIALVTGAGRGIGAATARLLAERGARVFLLARTRTQLDETARAINAACKARGGSGAAVAYATDVTDARAVALAFERVRAELGPISILVNNAGAVANARVEEMDDETWHRVLATNLNSAFYCAREAFKQMRARGYGSIVNIGSLAGIRSTEKYPGFSAYVAAKHGVVGLTEGLAAEGKEIGIRVNCVAPGAVDTQMLREAAPGLKSNTPPEAIAEVIAYLCDRQRSQPLNGAVIEVNTNA